MAKNTRCSRTHKTASQLEPSYCWYRFTVGLDTFLLAPLKNKITYQFGTSLHFPFPTQSFFFHAWYKYDNGYSYIDIGSHILIIIFMHSFISGHFLSGSFTSIYLWDFIDDFRKTCFHFFSSFQGHLHSMDTLSTYNFVHGKIYLECQNNVVLVFTRYP